MEKKRPGSLMATRRLEDPDLTWPIDGACDGGARVELGGLEPPTPCLQSDVSMRCGHADLARQLSVSSHERPLLTPGNSTLMARRRHMQDRSLQQVKPRRGGAVYRTSSTPRSRAASAWASKRRTSC